MTVDRSLRNGRTLIAGKDEFAMSTARYTLQTARRHAAATIPLSTFDHDMRDLLGVEQCDACRFFAPSRRMAVTTGTDAPRLLCPTCARRKGARMD